MARNPRRKKSNIKGIKFYDYKAGERVVVFHKKERASRACADFKAEGITHKDLETWAIAKLTEFRTAHPEPAQTEGELPTVRELLEFYLAGPAKELKGEGYRNKVGIVRKLLNEDFVDKRIDYLTSGDINRFKKRELAHRAQSTVRHYLTTISAAIAAYQELSDRPELIPNVLLTKAVKYPKAHADDAQRRDIMLPRDASRLANLVAGLRGKGDEASYSQEDALAIRLLLSTGCRRGELVQLHKSDFDFVNNLVHFRAPNTKSGKPREVAVLPAVMGLIKKMFDDDPERAWFYQKTPQTLSRRFAKAARLAGYERGQLVLHHTRHHALTRMAGEMNPWELKKVSGHVTLEMLDKYVDMAASRKKGAAQGDAIPVVDQLLEMLGSDVKPPPANPVKPKNLSQTRMKLKKIAAQAEAKAEAKASRQKTKEGT